MVEQLDESAGPSWEDFNALLTSLGCPWPDANAPSVVDRVEPPMGQQAAPHEPVPAHSVPSLHPEPMADAVVKLGQSAGTRVRRGAVPLRHVVNLQLASWSCTEAEGRRLLAAHVDANTPSVKALSDSIRMSLTSAAAVASQFRRHLDASAPVAAQPKSTAMPLRLGFGSPSTLGCTDLLGTSVNYASLIGGRYSVQRAMQKLNLSCVGLPGARLHDSFSLPSESGLVVAARGGPSYASVAVVWRSDLGSAIKPSSELGSNRRM